MDAYTEAGRLHQQLYHQPLQNSSRDLLPGQSLQCDNPPDDKPATTLTLDSKTTTEMAWAHPQETK